MTTPLLMLRALQLGLTMRDLDYITIGDINDMYTEMANDQEKYDQEATQNDFDAF